MTSSGSCRSAESVRAQSPRAARKPAAIRGVRAEVAGQRHHPGGDAAAGECGHQEPGGAVGRAVVHQDQFEPVVRVAAPICRTRSTSPRTFSASLKAGTTRLTSGICGDASPGGPAG